MSRKSRNFEVECPFCGAFYEVEESWLEDNWNVGHYGCTSPEIVSHRFSGRCSFCENDYYDAKEELKRRREHE